MFQTFGVQRVWRGASRPTPHSTAGTVAGEGDRTLAPTKGLGPQPSAFDRSATPAFSSQNPAWILRYWKPQFPLFHQPRNILELGVQLLYRLDQNLLRRELAPGLDDKHEAVVLALNLDELRHALAGVDELGSGDERLVDLARSVKDLRRILAPRLLEQLGVISHSNLRLIIVIHVRRAPLAVPLALAQHSHGLELDVLPLQELGDHHVRIHRHDALVRAVHVPGNHIALFGGLERKRDLVRLSGLLAWLEHPVSFQVCLERNQPQSMGDNLIIKNGVVLPELHVLDREGRHFLKDGPAQRVHESGSRAPDEQLSSQ